MNTGKSVGRTVGVLVLLHMALGLMVPFIMLRPLALPPGFLVTAAGIPGRVRAAVMLLFVGSALAIAIACAALRVFRQYSSAMAYWLLALAVASFSLQAVDNAHLLSMLSLSQEYARAGAANSDLFRSLGAVLQATRKGAHYSFLLVIVCWIFLLCALLYRFRMVPRGDLEGLRLSDSESFSRLAGEGHRIFQGVVQIRYRDLHSTKRFRPETIGRDH
jgi:hypothetical protein